MFGNRSKLKYGPYLAPLPLSFYIAGSLLKWLYKFWGTPCAGFDYDSVYEGWSAYHLKYLKWYILGWRGGGFFLGNPR